MKLKLLFAPALMILISSCADHESKKTHNLGQSNPEEVRFQEIDTAAKNCTNFVNDASKEAAAKNITGKYTLTGAYYITYHKEGAVTLTIRRDIPYAKSTYLDNGVEGSVWRHCMKSQNALAPEIIFD